MIKWNVQMIKLKVQMIKLKVQMIKQKAQMIKWKVQMIKWNAQMIKLKVQMIKLLVQSFKQKVKRCRYNNQLACKFTCQNSQILDIGIYVIFLVDFSRLVLYECNKCIITTQFAFIKP